MRSARACSKGVASSPAQARRKRPDSFATASATNSFWRAIVSSRWPRTCLARSPKFRQRAGSISHWARRVAIASRSPLSARRRRALTSVLSSGALLTAFPPRSPVRSVVARRPQRGGRQGTDQRVEAGQRGEQGAGLLLATPACFPALGLLRE